VLADDADILTWCQSKYGSEASLSVFVGYSEVNSPDETNCPFAVISPQSHSFGDETTESASLVIAWAVMSPESVTENDAVELQGMYDTDALGRLIWQAINNNNDYTITQTDYSLDGVGTEVFPGGMEITLVPNVSGAYKPNHIKSVTIYPVSSESEANTSYGSGITIVDAGSFGFTPNYLENNVDTAQGILCTNSKLLDGEWSLEIGAFAPGFMDTLLGGSELDYGSTPAYFKLVVVSECPSGAEITETLYRCKVNTHNWGKSAIGSNSFNVSGICTKRRNDNKIYDISVST